MTDDELSRLLDEYDTNLCGWMSANQRNDRHAWREKLDISRAAIHAHFERRKSGEGGEDALSEDERKLIAKSLVMYATHADYRACAIGQGEKRNDGSAYPKGAVAAAQDAAEAADKLASKMRRDAARTEGKGNG